MSDFCCMYDETLMIDESTNSSTVNPSYVSDNHKQYCEIIGKRQIP
jgi:hypothetical protein